MTQKPALLRVVFIMNALLSILPFIFYYIFTTKNIEIEGLKPEYMLYTGLGYMTTFILMITTILKRKLYAFRSIFILVILISLPAKAYIGIAFATISILLSFHKKIKLYFNH